MSEENKPIVALLGDIGGTNIRYELVVVNTGKNEPEKTLKKETYLVEKYDVFSDSVKKFLEDAEFYPNIAVIGMAGPIADNTVAMANVPKWGTLDGEELSKTLNIAHFRFINDFEAASYGVLLVPETDFVPLNGKQADENKLRGIMGPGTGLGNSTLYPAKVKQEKQVFVLPSEGGHTDFPTVDDETREFNEFMLKETNYKYISLERSFCGPTIPYMFRFFANKFSEDAEAKETPTSEQIIVKAVEPNPTRIYESAFNLFLKLYSAAIGNFLSQHMCTGGIYLVGSLTNSIISRIKDTDFLAGFKNRHPEVAHVIEKIPIVVCKEIDLGLKGAYFVARRIASDNS